MRVLLVNSLDKHYGSTYRARLLRRALHALGHKCIYVESNCTDDLGLDVFSVSQRDNFVSYLLASLRRVFLCLRLDYDICFIQKALPVSILTVIAAKLRGKRVILDWDDLEVYFQVSRIRRLIIAVSEKIIARMPIEITTHSRFIDEYIKDIGAKDVSYLPQAIDESFFRDDFDVAKLREKYSTSGFLTFCYLVTFNIGSTYDFDGILEVYKKIESLFDNALLVIVGDGILRDRIKDKAAGYGLRNYRFLGFVEHDAVAGLIAACDFGLIYMRDNNLPNEARVSLKLLEYCAGGKPVIGRVVGESKRLLGDYVYDAGYCQRFISNDNISKDIRSAKGKAREVAGADRLGCRLGELLHKKSYG